MPLTNFVGVILAAGKGTRMLPLTARWPKAVLPILGLALARHHIETMRAVGIRKIFVVIGHLGYEVVRALGDGTALGVSLEYVEQPETLGIAHALGRLERHIHGPFLLFLGDVYFVSSELGTMMDLFARGGVAGVLASKVEERPEMIRRNFAILAEPDGTVRRVIEKPRSVENKLKGCGIYLFGPEVFDAIRRTPRTPMRDEYEITDSIQILIDSGHRLLHSNVVQEDLNLTIPEDLLAVNAWELKRRGLDNLFLGDAPPDLTGRAVHGVVAGAGVTLGPGAELRNCVIFDGCAIAAGACLANAIVTPDGVLQCNPTGEDP